MKRRAWPKQTPSYPGPMHATMPSCSISACRTATVGIYAPSSVAMEGDPGHHADRCKCRSRRGSRARCWCERLYRQALRSVGIAGAVRAQLRVFDNSEDAVFTIGPYLFRPSVRLLLQPARNRKIRLTDKETSILKFLYRAGGKTVPRQVLLNEVWGYSSAVTTHTLETHIYRLRQKAEPDPSQPRLLLTESGGYRLDPVASMPAG